MKDQYFGDFGDYQKVSLLRSFQKEDLSVLVHWMRTRNDGGTDGKHISYLEKPELWKAFDAEVFEFLKSKVASGKRLLSHIEESDLCSRISFLNDYIEDEKDRSVALNAILESSAEIVLFDPDNGIEVASTNKKSIHKYVTWNEIIKTFESGKSVIIYQHFSRTNRKVFIQKKVKEIQQKISCSVAPLQVRHSIYFFLMQTKHETRLRKAIKEFSTAWQHLATIHQS